MAHGKRNPEQPVEGASSGKKRRHLFNIGMGVCFVYVHVCTCVFYENMHMHICVCGHMHVCVYRHMHTSRYLFSAKKAAEVCHSLRTLEGSAETVWRARCSQGNSTCKRGKQKPYLAVEERKSQCTMPSSLAGELLSVIGLYYSTSDRNAWTKIARP